MNETQALVKNTRQQDHAPPAAATASYGSVTHNELVGEALLHAADDDVSPPAFSKPASNGFAARGHPSRPQSMDQQRQPHRSEHQLALQKIPVQQLSHHNHNGIAAAALPPSGGTGLPPAIPLRRRLDSASSEHSFGGSGRARLQRSASDGMGAGVHGVRPPGPPRPVGVHAPHGPEETSSRTFGAGSHRRTHSYDFPQRRRCRGLSSNSLVSLGSEGMMNSETVRLLPDPRWGGGSGGGRARSHSGGSHSQSNSQWSLPHPGNACYSSDSVEGAVALVAAGGGYGSTSADKEVIMHLGGGATTEPRERRRHRRAESDFSSSSFGTAASVDRSVEPAVADMRKSSMFKGVTSEGVVRMQLPKDNFRLLSDRDLGECTACLRGGVMLIA